MLGTWKRERSIEADWLLLKGFNQYGGRETVPDTREPFVCTSDAKRTNIRGRDKLTMDLPVVMQVNRFFNFVNVMSFPTNSVMRNLQRRSYTRLSIRRLAHTKVLCQSQISSSLTFFSTAVSHLLFRRHCANISCPDLVSARRIRFVICCFAVRDSKRIDVGQSYPWQNLSWSASYWSAFWSPDEIHTLHKKRGKKAKVTRQRSLSPMTKRSSTSTQDRHFRVTVKCVFRNEGMLPEKNELSEKQKLRLMTPFHWRYFKKHRCS